MCSPACIEFVRANLEPKEVTGQRVLEVGAYDVNGSVRPIIERLGPARYVGVDIQPGPGVDEICEASQLVERFGAYTFDVVISTEMLEHVRDWRASVANMKRVLRPGGVLVLTTRSEGFGYHAFPHDFWRFSTNDMRIIFGDCSIRAVESDPLEPGVFVKAGMPLTAYVPHDLASYALYSMVLRRRALDVSDEQIAAFNLKYQLAMRALQTRSEVWQRVLRLLPWKVAGVAVTLREQVRGH